MAKKYTKNPSDLKAYVSDFTISLSPFKTTGRIVGMQKSGTAKATSLTSICPQCLTGGNIETVKQYYTCQEQHGPYTSSELAKAKAEGKDLVPVNPDAVDAARTSPLPKDYLELTVHPADQVEALTWPDGNAYTFYPKHSDETYGIMAELVSETSLAFIGVVNLRGHETFVRLTSRNGLIIVQKLLWPENIEELESNPDLYPTVTYKPETMELMTAFVSKQLRDFNPDDYRQALKDRIGNLTAENPVEVPVKSTEPDMLAMLQAMLQEA